MGGVSRRSFLKMSSGVAVGFLGLRSYATQGFAEAAASVLDPVGYGGLVADPKGVVDLPLGFRYTVISRTGEEMDDGLLVPAAHDGMATFPGPGGRTIIIRNHELSPDDGRPGPFGSGNERLSQAGGRLYDNGTGEFPGKGGTTTLVFDTRTQKLESHWLSLAGTDRNCAGGPTPWNTWVTCEESVRKAGDKADHDHGYCFEVPATSRPALADPVPLKDMGRFNHEAVAVDPATGYVYLTEDRGDGLLYRFVPNVPGKLHRGGKLQALVIRGARSTDTRNWGDGPRIRPLDTFDVEWMDVEDVEAPKDDLRHRGFEAGAARFARGEGAAYGNGAIYITCTNGGMQKKGQIWKLTPGAEGGTDQLELFLESQSSDIVENCDNLTVAPWGDLYICEDGAPDQYVVGVTRSGRPFKFARNAMNGSELAGATFSPDGSTLFVNIQNDPGLTLAITGPWDRQV